jgi:hypothetical protein
LRGGAIVFDQQYAHAKFPFLADVLNVAGR